VPSVALEKEVAVPTVALEKEVAVPTVARRAKDGG